MSIGMIAWSVLCFGAGFAAHSYVQRFAWFKKIAKRVKKWAAGK